MNEERLHKLWENTGRLNNKFTIDYEAFKNDMNDMEKRHRFYESVRKLNPNFTVTAEQADIDLGFISEQLSVVGDNSVVESETNAKSKKRDGYQTMIDSHTSFAEKHIKEQEEKKAQQAKVQDNYLNAGLSEQYKTDRAEYEKLMSDKAMNQISETFGIEQPKVNQYGMPVVEPAKEDADLTTISRPRTVGTGEEVIPFKSSEQKADEKIAAMPSYITRGEDDTHKINANAFERALNTKEGKELYKQIFDNEAFLFKHSNEGMALLEQYRNGEISEEDFELIFREKVGPTIDEEFLGEITSEGGIMRDYFVVAREKLGKDTSKKEANAVDYAIQEYELEKEKEFDNKVREAYKDKYGVYPEEDKSVRYNAANDGLLLRWRRLEDIKSNIREQEQTGYRTSEITGETKEYRKDLPQILQISGAKEFNEDAKEIIDAVENKGLGDFFKALGRTATDMDTWDLGISALLRNGALLEVVEKADRKEKLTREEQLLMDAALNYMAVSAFYSNSLGRGYKAGTTSAASIPFMIQFALSAGALSAMEASLTGSAKAVGTKLINALAKHGMQKMANVTASEATKAIGKASVGMLSSLIGAGALTAAWDTPSIASGSIERQIGDIAPVYNEEGNAFVYGGREHKQSPKEATWNAFADKYVERLSEMVLAKTFAPIEAYASGTRMFKSLAKNDVVGAILDIRNTPFIKGLREKAMFGGLFEEMMEEELGGLLRMATMSDVNTFKEAGLDMDGQIDIFLGLAPTSLLFSVGGTASHYGKLAVRSKKLRDSLVTDAERKLFDNLMSESRSGKFGELAHDFIRNVILADRTKDGRKITNEDKRDALITVLTKYQDVLSEELKSQTKAVKKEENDAAIDNAVQNMRYKETDDIFFVKDENGKKYVIVDGNVGFNQIQGGLVVDSSRSDSHVSVREVLGNGRLSKVEKVRTASLTDNVHPMSTKTYTEWNQAKHQAEVDEKETFEYNGIVFDTATSKRLGTKEEYEKKKKEDEAVKNEGKPTINTEPRKMKNEKFQLVVDGKKQSVTFYNAGLVQNEDGSINKEDSDLFIIEVNGEKVSRRNQEEYIDALSEHLKSEHEKAIDEYNQNTSDNVEPEAPATALTDEDRAAAAAEQERKAKEAERQSILSDIQQNKTKQGEIQMDKLTPEETLLVYQNEETPESLMQLLAEQLQYLRSQETDIQGKDLSPIEKKNKTRKIQQSIAAYEAAIEKWLGQEALAVINAPVEVSLVQEETPASPPVQAPVVEPVQSETPVTAEPIVAPEEDTPQDDVPAEPDTTPLPLAEPVIENGEVNEEEKEPMNLLDGQYAIVGSNSTRGKEQIVKVTQNEDGTETWTSIHDGSVISQKANKKQQFPEQENMRVLGIKEGNTITPVVVLSGRADLSQEKGELKVVPVNTKDGKVHSVHVSLLYKPEADGGWSLLKGVGSRVLSPAEAAKYNSLDALLDFPIIPNVTVGNFTLKDMLEYPTLGKLKSRLEQLGIEYDKQTINTNLETALSRWRELVRENNLNDEFKNNINKLSPSTLAAYKLFRAGVEPFKAGVPAEDTRRTRSNINLYVQLDSIGMLPNNISNPLAQLAVLAEVASELGIIRKKAKGRYISAIEDIQKKTLKAVNENEQEFTGKPKETVEEKATEGKQSEQPKTETSKQQKPKTEAKEETPAPAKRKTNIDSLRDTFVEAYARTQNQSYNALQKTTAKNAFKGMIDKMSEEDAVALYLNLAMESAKSQGKMQEDMVNAAKALIDSKHGAAINAITGGVQQDTNPTPVESTEVATEETEQTAEDAIDYEALVAERNELQETIYDMEEDEAANANARIAQINEMLRNRPEFMVGDVVAEHAESTKRIIKILKAAGIRVVTFKNEDLPKYVSKKKLEELSDGQIVYGFASNDTIYLNEDHFNPNSPLHEFTHLWVTAYKQAFPNEWKRFVEIANKSALAANLRKPLQDGKDSPYAKLSADEMASEVLSRYTGYLYGELDAEGRTAFEKMMQAQTMEEKIAEKSLLKRIRDFWKKVISFFDKSIENEKEEDAIDDMIRQFAQAPMETLARGKEAVDELKQIAKQGYKVQSVYHGTAAEFSQFDHDFMGSGEGAQAYGWGTYVSQVENIAISYAKEMARKGRNITISNNPFSELEPNKRRFFENFARSYVRDFYQPDYIIAVRNVDDFIRDHYVDAVNFLMDELYGGYYVVDYSYRNDIVNESPDIYSIVERIAEEIDSIKGQIEDATNDRNDYTSDMIPRMEEVLHKLEAAYRHNRWFSNTLKELTDKDINTIEHNAQEIAKQSKRRHLYEVQIPAESYLEDGSVDLENSPYLGWDDTYMSGNKFFNAIMNAIKEYRDKRMRRYQELKDRMVFRRSRPSNFENSPEDLSEYWDIQLNSSWIADAMRRTECTGGYFYDCIENMFGSPKAASEWLLSQGILGVRVSTGATSGKKRDTKNYVIFNEADAHIVNHTAFMINTDGKLMLNNTSENLDNSKKSSTFAQNNENYERNDERTMDGEVPSGSRRGESRTDSNNGEGRRLPVRDVPRANGGYDANVAQSVAEQSRLLSKMLTERGIKHTSQQVKLATPQEFYDAIIEAKQLNPHGWMVDAYEAEDYAGFTCLLTEDGKSGIAIKPNGDIISVFSSVKRDNRLQMLMPMAIMQGGRKLDCYYLQGENGNIYGLPKLYSTFGFKIAATTNFVEEYVPQEEYARWKEEHDGSIHGVAAMYISDEVANDLINSYSISATPNTNAQNFPSTDTGYGEALAERDKLMILENARANGTIGTINGKKSNLPDELWAVVRTDAFKDWFGDWQNDPDNASKVLDENGEPLVVYHGSKMAGFDEFQQLDESVNGFFTTDNKAGANTYATNREERRNNVMADEAQLNAEPHHGIYSLFANIKNPAVYDFAGKMYNEYGEPQGYYVEMSGEEWDMLPVPKFATEEEALAFARENGEPDSAVKTTYLSTDDLVEMAKAAGHDGVIFKNVLDGAEHNEEMPVMNDYIAFEPNQLKSATQNIGAFSSEDNRLEFMIGPAAPSGTPITDPTLMLDEEALKALEVKSKKYAAKLANPKVQLPEEIGGMFVARNFDRTEGIRRIMNSIAEYRKAHGMPKMGEGFDVRTMIETKDSKINNKIASFDNNQVKRLEKIVRKWAKVIKKSAMYEKYKNEQMRNQDGEVTTLTPIEFLERYLIACDSIEREALTKNPRGIGGFLNRMGISVIQFHNEFVSEFASDTNGKKMREELWEAVRGVTRVTLEVGKESGLISQEEYDKDIKRQFYVPERDFAEVEANKQLWIEGAAWRKSKRGARLRAMQKSKEQGGLSLAANILSNMLDLTYDAIVKAEENKVKVAMFDLLSANETWCNENRVPVPVRVWYEKDADGKPVRRTTEPSRSEREEMKKYKGEVRKLENLILNETDKKLIYESKIDELKEELKKNHTPEERLDIETGIRELETLILQINDNIDEWHEDIDVYKSMYPYMDTIDVRNILFETKEQQKAETVIAYVDGEPCEMHFPNMQIVADALNNVSYNDWYFDDIKKVTSYASAIFTVYNPTFFTVNLARDIPWIIKKGYSEYGWEFPVRFAAKLIAETFSSTLWKAVAGKDYSDSIYAEHMREFYEGGGNTGYTQLPEMQRIKKHVAKWGEKKLITWGDVGNVMSFMNEWSEVLTRSAAYSVVRDMGYNQEEGIRAAKNLSVNFNRKGLGSKFMNLFSSFSMFANAVVQGACGFYRTFKPNEDTQLQRAMHVTRAVMSIGLAPAFSGFISTLLQPDDEDDFLVSDWERDNYFILGNVRIPLSEQLKPFWCIGVNIALGMQGKRNGKDIARSLINSFFVNLVPAPNSFNSTLQMLTDAIFGYKDFSGAALVDNLLTPQVLKNTNSIANNSNFMGGKFRYDYGDVPEFAMGENDPYIYRCIAELAYNMAGGDEYVKSTSVKEVNEYGEVEYIPMNKAMNINPKQIEAWASVFVPSGFRDIANAVAVTIGKIAGDEDAKFEAKEFNSVTRFYKQQDKELNQYFLLKDIKKEIEYYNYVKSTAKKNIIGAEITGNEEWLESAETKFESLSNNTLKQIEASLIEQYDKLHMDKIARKYALTGDELKEHLSDKEIIKIDKERDNILRKILILDMERKGNELFTYDDFEKVQKYSEEEKRDILESQIYNEVRKKRPK